MADQNHFRRLERLFHEALERDPSGRAAFLDEACGDDDRLRRDVEELLRHHMATGELFGGSRALAESLLRGTTSEIVEGRTVGPYRLVREIGAGGMGRVFLAERHDLPKRVALKLVREPLASPDRIRRFRLEQQVLAGLDHPHIAQLLDAGVTDDGSPWFAMEHVDGELITTYCDRRRYTVDQRLRLFLRLCDAVRYAHAHLIIHCDIKPSNVMVTGDGRPKLLDFGVAKLLDPAGDPDPTRTGLRAVTPAYAAPEQLLGGRVSTATDVYQLGALLYELLTGRPPLDLARKTPGEAERIVQEQEPAPPATAVRRAKGPRGPSNADAEPGGAAGRAAHAGETGVAGAASAQADGVTSADVAHARSTTPDRLRRRLAGDVGTVVLKALAREPERRYASVEALAADVGRVLDHHPVLARPGTPLYRARKYLLRHKAAAAIGVVLVAYAGTVTASAMGIARERARAEREAATATRVSDFLVDVFTRADPLDTVPGQATALDLANRGAAQVDSDLSGEPEIQSAMQEVLGRVYHGFGDDQRAEPLLRASLDTRLRLFGPESPEVASARHYLAQVLWANGELDAADSLNQRALDVRRRLFDPTDPKLWETLGNLGTVRQSQGRLEEAEQMVAEVVVMVRRAHPDGHPTLGAYLNNLANIRFARGDYAGAQATMQQALDNDRRYLPAGHADIALRLDNLGYMAFRAGDFDDALAKSQEALAMYWSVYGAPHPDMPYAMATIADAALVLGDTVRADSMHIAALDMRRSLLGPDHQDLFRGYRDLGQHMMATGRAAEAEAWFREALRIARLTRGEDHEWFASALWGLGLVRHRLGEHGPAETLMRRAHAIHVEALGEDHPVVAEEREFLAAEFVPARSDSTP